MQMQEEIRQHHHHAVAPIDRRRMAENALPDLRFADDFAERCHGEAKFQKPTIRTTKNVNQTCRLVLWSFGSSTVCSLTSCFQTGTYDAGSFHWPSSC